MRKPKNTLRARFIFNFPLGLLIGSCLALGFAMLIDEDVNAVILDHYVSTAIAAAASILSASLAIGGVLWNLFLGHFIKMVKPLIQTWDTKKCTGCMSDFPVHKDWQTQPLQCGPSKTIRIFSSDE